MDVSNSTGQNTGYRVMGSAGSGRPAEGKPTEGKRGKGKEKDKPAGKVPAPLEELHAGDLDPHTYVTLNIPSGYDCTVVFLRGKEEIAKQKVEPGDVLIALVPNAKGVPKPHVCRRKA